MVAERRAAQTTFGSPRVCEWQHLNWTFYELLTIKERGAMGMSRVWRLGEKRGHFCSCLLCNALVFGQTFTQKKT